MTGILLTVGDVECFFLVTRTMLMNNIDWDPFTHTHSPELWKRKSPRCQLIEGLLAQYKPLGTTKNKCQLKLNMSMYAWSHKVHRKMGIMSHFLGYFGDSRYMCLLDITRICIRRVWLLSDPRRTTWHCPSRLGPKTAWAGASIALHPRTGLRSESPSMRLKTMESFPWDTPSSSSQIKQIPKLVKN